MSEPPSSSRSPDGELHAALARCGARIVLRDSEAYPAALAELSRPPDPLFAIGSLDVLAPPVIAIVGTRRPTEYGERVARELARSLARAGACIVSGLARGIDGIAHQAALDERGRTVGVLGTGIDVAYPAAHRPLHRAIARKGLLLSEFPPGLGATKGSFPRRNRIIAALAQTTIVVEGGVRSGALNTALQAVEMGRTVAAVPGPIDAPQSAGTNELLRDGAVVIAEIADALALAGLTSAPARSSSLPGGGDERVVWEALAAGGSDLDELSARTRLPAHRCLAAVTTLELAGAIECRLTGEVRRR